MWTVEQTATRSVVTASPESTVGQCEILMLKHGFRHLPMVDGDRHPTGLVTDRRVLGLTRRDLHHLLASHAADPIQVVAPITIGVRALVQRLITASQGAAVLVDDRDQLAGIYTIHDAMRFAETQLPLALGVADVGGTRPEMAMVPLGSAAWQAREIMLENQIHHLVVTRPDGKLAGMVSLRDLAGRELTTIDGRMQAITHRVAPGDDLHKAVSLMVKHKIGSLPVVVENDTPVGVITRTDILRAIVDKLPTGKA